MAYNPVPGYPNPAGMVPSYSPYSYINYQNQPQTPYSQPMPNNMAMQNQGPASAPSASIQGRMVTSKEEALGVPVDFSGAPILLADLSHNAIFVKKFN